MASNTRPIPLARDSEVERLFQQWRQPLVRFLICTGLTADDALDIVQDTFLRLHQHLASDGAAENLRAWVFQVAQNAALNRRKSGAYRLSASLDSDADVRERAVSPRDDPERELFKKERFRRLHEAMKGLSVVERGCVLLRSEGLRYREIAEVLEIGTSTVADHLDRALRKLGEKCNV